MILYKSTKEGYHKFALEMPEDNAVLFISEPYNWSLVKRADDEHITAMNYFKRIDIDEYGLELALVTLFERIDKRK